MTSQDTKKANPIQIAVAIIAGSITLIVAIVMIANFAVAWYANRSLQGDPAMSDVAVAKRLKPVAELVVVDASAPKASKSAEEVYNGVCAACHASGLLSAPKLGDKDAWGPRIAQGYDILVKHAVEGIRQMPAKGGSTDLSDVEVARAIAYMANSAGAKFTPPEPAPQAPATQTTAAPAQPQPAAPATPTPAVAAAPAATAAATPAAAPAAAAPAAASSGTADSAKGKTVYDSICQTCHATGLAGAPKAGDKAAWAPRIAQGAATLYEHALKGKGAMPPKGGNTALPDDDVKAAVDYMVSQAK
jgi:cytochrome c5